MTTCRAKLKNGQRCTAKQALCGFCTIHFRMQIHQNKLKSMGLK